MHHYVSFTLPDTDSDSIPVQCKQAITLQQLSIDYILSCFNLDSTLTSRVTLPDDILVV